MIYCKICLDPSTRPKIEFNSNGVCFACSNFINEKKNYNENNRLRILSEIVEKFKNKSDKKNYDCILGISGGKDSTRQALWLRDKLNVNPLLVCCSYPPEQITDVGAKNLSNLMDLGFNIIVTAPAPNIWRKSVRKSFMLGNYLLGPEIALYSSLPQIAIKYNLKLIFWGESPAIIWNDKKTKSKYGYDGNNLRYSNTLKNCDIKWMKSFCKDKTKLLPYIYPSKKEFKKHKLQIIYLSWFWKNWTFLNNAKYSCLNGLKLKTDDASKNGDLYGITAIDDTWVSVNQMIKYLKFGFGRTTDYLNFEIRKGNIDRDEAIKFAKKYDGKCDKKYIKDFCNYIQISEKKFYDKLFKITNKNIFSVKKTKKSFFVKPKFSVGKGLN